MTGVPPVIRPDGTDRGRLRDALADRPDGCRLILAPPRTCSTLLARILWGETSFGAYAHEPFDGTYHGGTGLAEAIAKLRRPLELSTVPGCPPRTGNALLLKELTFQVDPYFTGLVELVRLPVIFAIRDPRLSVASRMRKRAQTGADPVFPVIETGWSLLRRHIEHCRTAGIDYVVVDGHELRAAPEHTIRSLCAAVGLAFTTEMLAWSPADGVSLNCTVEAQNQWNDRVLASSTIEPAVEPIPPLESFPVAGGMREHVAWSLDFYRELRADTHTIRR